MHYRNEKQIRFRRGKISSILIIKNKNKITKDTRFRYKKKECFL